MSSEKAASVRLSIVIPAYNMEEYVAETLKSVLRDPGELQVIVVDDGSTDRTVDIVKGFDDPRLELYSKPNAGVSAARNYGLERVRGRFVLFLDADDILAEGAASTYGELLDAHREIQALCASHHKFANLWEDLPAIVGEISIEPIDGTLEQLLRKNFIVNGGALCMRTELARAVDGYDERLRLGEDREFWCRAAMQGDFHRAVGFFPLHYRVRASGCNRKWRGSAWKANYEEIDVTYNNPAIRSYLGEAKVKRLRRMAMMDDHWVSARFEIAEGRYLRFLEFLVAGLIRFPESVIMLKRIGGFLRTLRLAER